jgi:hypothetical protein
MEISIGQLRGTAMVTLSQLFAGQERSSKLPGTSPMSLSLESAFAALLKSLHPRPVDQKTLVELVNRALQDSVAVSTDDNRKSQWEYLLKNEIYRLAVRTVQIRDLLSLIVHRPRRALRSQ